MQSSRWSCVAFFLHFHTSCQLPYPNHQLVGAMSKSCDVNPDEEADTPKMLCNLWTSATFPKKFSLLRVGTHRQLCQEQVPASRHEAAAACLSFLLLRSFRQTVKVYVSRDWFCLQQPRAAWDHFYDDDGRWVPWGALSKNRLLDRLESETFPCPAMLWWKVSLYRKCILIYSEPSASSRLLPTRY